MRSDFERFRTTPAEHFVMRSREWVPRHPNVPVPQQSWLYRTVHVGQLLSEYHHWQHRAQTATIHFRSASDVAADLDRRPLSKDRERIRRATKRPLTDDECLFDAIRTNSSLMTLTHFRASVSKHLCDTYQARRVLDFSAGWGDRMTGFLASDSVHSITLVDPRPGSLEGCRRQHEFVHSTQTWTLLQKGAEEVLPTLESGSFDLIVASPPYFNLEHDGETEKEAVGQIRNKVEGLDEFKEVFLRPVLLECVRLLAPGGILALNVDDNPKAKVFLCEFALSVLDEKAEPIYVFQLSSQIAATR